MAKVEEILDQMKRSPQNISFSDLCKVCDFYFGEPRQRASSHRIYKMPWAGDPRINIQSDKGKAQIYQVKQVLRAIEKLKEIEHGIR